MNEKNKVSVAPAIITLIATHNGVFHADDVVAVAVLKLLFPESNIIRTRDEKKLAEATVRVDVGAKYNPETGDFDHHQRGRAGTRENGVQYSSLGLVWLHYGVQACDGDAQIARIVDEGFVQPIDCQDNGQALNAGPSAFRNGSTDLLPYSVSMALSSLNPSWDEKPDFDNLFIEAVKIAQIVLQREIALARGQIKARGLVVEAIRTSNVSEDPRILILEKFCPWQESFFEAEDKDGQLPCLFTLYPSETGTWMIQAIPPKAGSFEQRKSLPEPWAGKRAKELIELTGVSDAVFCHPGRFIGGAESKEGALKLVKLALES